MLRDLAGRARVRGHEGEPVRQKGLLGPLERLGRLRGWEQRRRHLVRGGHEDNRLGLAWDIYSVPNQLGH